jgi:hypothetical protein
LPYLCRLLHAVNIVAKETKHVANEARTIQSHKNKPAVHEATNMKERSVNQRAFMPGNQPYTYSAQQGASSTKLSWCRFIAEGFWPGSNVLALAQGKPP